MPPSASLSCSPPTRATVPFSQRVMPLKVNPAHHAHPRILRGPGPARGPGWLLLCKSVAEQFQQHQRLVDVAHPHPLGDERAHAKEGSRGAGGHGVMVGAAGRPGQVWLWAARQAIAPAGIPSGLGVMRLQPTRHRVWGCRPSPSPTSQQLAEVETPPVGAGDAGVALANPPPERPGARTAARMRSRMGPWLPL
jgi:hypothetical protein